jgi:hypothetical protein
LIRSSRIKKIPKEKGFGVRGKPLIFFSDLLWERKMNEKSHLILMEFNLLAISFLRVRPNLPSEKMD